MKNERLRYALKIHKADIHSLLKTMCIEGLLFSDGHGRGTKYYLLDSANAGRNLERNLGSNIGSNRTEYAQLNLCDICGICVGLGLV